MHFDNSFSMIEVKQYPKYRNLKKSEFLQIPKDSISLLKYKLHSNL